MGLAELSAAPRTCGRVDEYEREYVETAFLCAVRLPLVPRRSFWIMETGGARIGFPIRLDLRSVAAAYLRAWAVPVGVAALVVWPSLGGVLVAAALFALFARSWTWWPRDPDALWRIDFDLAAFGSRCDTARMTPAMRARLAEDLARRRADDPAIRTPDEVMDLGPRTAEEALMAYGELCLAEDIAPGLRVRTDLVDQVMRHASRRRRVGDPFRDRFVDSEATTIWDDIDQAAAIQLRDRRSVPGVHCAVPPRALPAPAWLRSPQTWLGVLTASTALTVGPAWIALWHWPSGPTPQLTWQVFAMAAALATVAGWLTWLRLRWLRQHTEWLASL
jgi:hypothetical protein